jgi:hypothetical protein
MNEALRLREAIDMSTTTTGIVPELFDVTLHAPNLEELGRFYERLGLRKAIDDDDLKVFILGVNELEIHRADAEVAPATSVSIPVRVDRIEPVVHSLKAQAIDYDGPHAEADVRALIVSDPNGNLVRFVESARAP